MDVAAELANVLVETLLVLYFLNRVFGTVELRKAWAIAAFAAYGIILSLLSIYVFNLVIREIFALASVLMLSVIVYKRKLLGAIYASLAFNVMVFIADVLCLAILHWLGISTESLALGGSARLSSIVVAKIIVLAEIQLLLHVVQQKDAQTPRWTIPLLIGQALSICAASFMLRVSIDSQLDSRLIILLCGSLLYLNLIICFYIETIKASYDNLRQKDLAEQQLQLQIERYELESAAREATRALWHDIKKYMYAMQDLIAGGKTDEAAACLNQVNSVIAEIHQTVDVGNVVIDGILERALEQIRSTEITLEFDVWIPEKLPIAAADLSIVIGNTLDNAIESCLRVDGPSNINLTLRQNQRMLLYEIQNPIGDEHCPKAGEIHGYGLRNVRQCVAKYQGDIEILNAENTFKVSIQIPTA